MLRAADESTLRAILHGIVWVVAATSAGCDEPPITRDASAPVEAGTCLPTHAITMTDSDCPTEATLYPCELPPDLMDASVGKVLDLDYCDRHCTITSLKGGTYCYLQSDDAGLSLQCQIQCIGGRRPEGYRARPSSDGLVGWFARMATLESASVAAFERLSDELAAHGAPDELIDRARSAADDERRHAAWMGGGELERAATDWPVRDLRAVATENAVEGCVREAYGALVATWQAAHSEDEAVASTMDAIARDETRHAALSWAVHAWALGRLGEADRQAVREAMDDAWQALRREVAEPGAELVAVAGLPRVGQQRALLARMGASLL